MKYNRQQTIEKLRQLNTNTLITWWLKDVDFETIGNFKLRDYLQELQETTKQDEKTMRKVLGDNFDYFKNLEL